MKAPDKIYIPIIEEEGKKLLCTNWWVTDTSSRNAYVKETIPYIRKDALLEWARNMYEKTMTFVSGDIERDNEIQKFALRIVKHIESL